MIVLIIFAYVRYTFCTISIFIELGKTDRHHCFMSSDIPKTEGGQNYFNFVTVLMSVMKFYWHKKEDLRE